MIMHGLLFKLSCTCVCVSVMYLQNLNLSSYCLVDFINKSTKLLNLPNRTITTTTRGGGVGLSEARMSEAPKHCAAARIKERSNRNSRIIKLPLHIIINIKLTKNDNFYSVPLLYRCHF